MSGADAVKASVCIPWIDTGCEHRQRAHHFVWEWWMRFDADVWEGISLKRPPNRSHARNVAARLSCGSVVVFADADTFVSRDQLARAVETAARTGRIAYAFTRLVRLDRSATERVLEGGQVGGVGQVVHRQPNGVIAVTRELFDEVGGFDERFVGWGGEDRAFQFACETMAGPGEVVAGPGYHLWHPRDSDQARKTSRARANLALAARYKAAAGVVAARGPLPRSRGAVADREAMLAILSEPGGPLSSVNA